MRARPRALKRRTFRKIRQASEATVAVNHHNVYVVLLDPAVARVRKVLLANPNRNPERPVIYVGLTGLNPEERFANHQQGVKSSLYVKRYGIRLVPELYVHLNPMPYEAAAQMEKDLTEDLRRAGYTVVGGH
jgi:predicted GIY-YIG superfamily endonuclease